MHYEILYVSSLAPNAPLTAVSDIFARSRQFNAAQGIGGLLVFDGARFAHLLEGERETLLALSRRIRGDPRHTDMEVLHYGDASEPHLPRFLTGYVPSEETDALDALATFTGPAALAWFRALLPALDLER